MSSTEASAVDRALIQQLAIQMAVLCVRNTSEIETLHAGIFPSSATGDFTDVKVVTPYGEIPWPQLSRISDPEMRDLMRRITDLIFTVLSDVEGTMRVPAIGREKFDLPKLDQGLARAVEKARR